MGESFGPILDVILRTERFSIPSHERSPIGLATRISADIVAAVPMVAEKLNFCGCPIGLLRRVGVHERSVFPKTAFRDRINSNSKLLDVAQLIENQTEGWLSPV